ncbi:hypothetical protein D3874_12670 [Oleomonas cavernae]|uniref:Uncharacterized protein n=1 Tax=Oleomonas cavernae TaxID=2320859 RepID=A0A418WCL5_9PROT|nr:hypothetical protein [Oleomonas cavernae]RJF87773.1 hypothetical protein D3874_12670 [Oleomonas cavernae]
MPFILISLLLQVTVVIHIIRTGRDRIWIYVVVLLPMAGIMAYLVAELLPEMLGSRTARNLKRDAIKKVDPGRDLRARLDALEGADTVDNRRYVAEEYLRLRQFDDALKMYRSALSGIHGDDTALLMGAARAADGAGRAVEVLELLDHLRTTNPSFQSAEAHLLYAKALESLGREDEALTEYATLVTYAPGEEARCRYALLMQRQGSDIAAKALFGEIIARSNRADSRYRAAEKEWIDIAKRQGTA